jgi:hypothetical protein
MMAITQSALAQAMARDLKRVVPPEAGMRRAWVWSQHGFVDPERDYVELSILRDDLDDEMKCRFVGAVVDMMEERYPEANKYLHVFVSNGEGDVDLEEELRPGSEEVDLRRE